MPGFHHEELMCAVQIPIPLDRVVYLGLQLAGGTITMSRTPRPHVRLDDYSPAANVERREVVRRPSVPARCAGSGPSRRGSSADYTAKKRLRRAVSPLGVPAGGALLGSAPRVNPDQRPPSPLRFVPKLAAIAGRLVTKTSEPLARLKVIGFRQERPGPSGQQLC